VEREVPPGDCLEERRELPGKVGVKLREGWGSPLIDAMAILVAIGEGLYAPGSGLASRAGGDCAPGDFSKAGGVKGESTAPSSPLPMEQMFQWASYSPRFPEEKAENQRQWYGTERQWGRFVPASLNVQIGIGLLDEFSIIK